MASAMAMVVLDLTSTDPAAQRKLRAYGCQDRFQAGKHGLTATDHDRTRAINCCTPRASDRRIGAKSTPLALKRQYQALASAAAAPSTCRPPSAPVMCDAPANCDQQRHIGYRYSKCHAHPPANCQTIAVRLRRDGQDEYSCWGAFVKVRSAVRFYSRRSADYTERLLGMRKAFAKRSCARSSGAALRILATYVADANALAVREPAHVRSTCCTKTAWTCEA